MVEPPRPLPGQWPKAGQTIPYLRRDGEIWQFFAELVYPPMENGRFCAVKGELLVPLPDRPEYKGKPPARLKSAWLYDRIHARMFWCLCGAPLPDHPDDCPDWP